MLCVRGNTSKAIVAHRFRRLGVLRQRAALQGGGPRSWKGVITTQSQAGHGSYYVNEPYSPGHLWPYAVGGRLPRATVEAAQARVGDLVQFGQIEAPLRASDAPVARAVRRQR